MKIGKEVERINRVMSLVGTEENEKKKKICDELKKKQRADGRWGIIIRDMEQQKEIGRNVRKYCLHEELLFARKEKSRNRWVLCIPEEDIQKVLKIFHDEQLKVNCKGCFGFMERNDPGYKRICKVMSYLSAK